MQFSSMFIIRNKFTAEMVSKCKSKLELNTIKCSQRNPGLSFSISDQINPIQTVLGIV